MDYRLICAGLLAGLCLACTPEEAGVPTNDEDVFYASLEQPVDPDTKVYADENLMILWHADDRVSIFDRYTYNQEYRFTGETGDNAGTMAIVQTDGLVTGNALDHIYAVYPYRASTRISNEGVLTYTLPSEQVYAYNNMAPGSNAMVSVTDKKALHFKNLCGYLVLKLYGAGVSVSSVSVKGNSDEPLAGNATITMMVGGLPSLEMQAAASTKMVTMTCPEPVVLGATADDCTEFWFVLPPTSFTEGFTITVTGSNGGTFEKSTSKSIDIRRNALSRMAPIEVTLSEGTVPPNNEIWYTSTNGEIVELNSTDGFSVGLVSNTYSNGEGIIRFDGPVTSVGAKAFQRKSTLKSVSLPEGVISIGFEAFQRCSSLMRIDLPETLKTIGGYSFYGCESLPSIVLPSSLTSIGSWAFYGCKGLTTIMIPSSVTSFGEAILAGCSNLKRIEGDHATSDGRSLVLEKSGVGNLYAIAPYGLDTYEVSSRVKYVLGGVFADLTNLKEIIIPEGVTYVGFQAFASNVGITRQVLPETVTSMGSGLFRGCTNLQEVVLPSRITSIPSEFLSGAGSLKSVSIPSTVTSIDRYAFRNCSGLSSVSIPKSVQTISSEAFYKCTGLKSIELLPTVPPAGATKMFDDTGNCPIYVPASSVDDYKAAEYWNTYSDRIFANPHDGPYFEISPSEITLTGEGGAFTVSVVANLGYHVEVGPDWITEGAVTGDAESGFVHSFTAARNETDAERTGVVSFCDDEGNCHPVTITQRVAYTGDDWMDKTFVHHSLGMRFTATWCGWCPYMSESFTKAKQKLGDRFEYVNLHASSSDLAFAGTAALASQFQISGYPTGIVDGRTKINNSTDTDYVSNLIVSAVSQTESTYPTVTAVALDSKLSGRVLTVNVDAYIKASETYKITVVVLEDGIVHYQSGASNDYVHNKIARIALTSSTGDAFTAAAGEVKQFSYSTTVPDDFDLDKLSVLVWIQRKFGSQTVIQSASYGDYYVDNCRTAPVGTTAALE